MNKIILVIIVLNTLCGCANTPRDNIIYPVLIYSETVDSKLIEYYKRKDGTKFMRFKLNNGMVREMNMVK